MVAPMPSPIRSESEPLTGRKVSQRVISGTDGAFETGPTTLKVKITDSRARDRSLLSVLVELCYISPAEESFQGVFGQFLAKIPSSASLPRGCVHVFRLRLSIAPSTAPAIPFIAPRFPETSLYHLAFQSSPSLSLLPNISSIPSLVLIDMDT